MTILTECVAAGGGAAAHFRSKTAPRINTLVVRNLAAAAASAKAKAGSTASKTKKPPPGKKKSAPRGPKGGGEDLPEEARRYQNLVDACLNAPPLVRFLKEKDRLRELEREKLGIVSKERERELEQQKAAAKAKAKEGETAGEGLKIELTVEEGKRLAKESSRILMRQHREMQAGESARLKLKLAAIAALPDHLRIKATEPDLTPFPPTRIPASITPPLEGYIKEMARVAQKVTTTKKMR